jgi:hypothetical protein
MPSSQQYIPGVCNIGPVEIANRRRTGIISLIITIIFAGVLYTTRAPHLYRLLLFLPAAISASALIQAQLHFCAGFAQAGLFNFSDQLGKTDTVAQAEYRAKDKRKAIHITLAAAAIGLLVALLAVLA